jgi:hypothetical protein
MVACIHRIADDSRIVLYAETNGSTNRGNYLYRRLQNAYPKKLE